MAVLALLPCQQCRVTFDKYTMCHKVQMKSQGSAWLDLVTILHILKMLLLLSLKTVFNCKTVGCTLLKVFS